MGGLQLGLGGGQAAGVEVEQHQARAVAGEAVRHGAADAAGGAGVEHDLAGQAGIAGGRERLGVGISVLHALRLCGVHTASQSFIS